jgi:ribonuclease HI
VDRAVRMLEDWKLANNISSNARVVHDINCSNDPQVSSGSGHNYPAAPAVMSNSESNQIWWQPPTHGRVKCNTDAAFYEHRNSMGIGLCIRDDEGTFILAKVILVSPVCSVHMGEALALFYALEWLSDMSFDHVDFCSDSKVTVDAFHQNRVDVTEIGHILSACRQMFTTHFTNSKVEFSRR